jgi:acetyl-CoA carboxylase biotin carboxyl carrier protein
LPAAAPQPASVAAPKAESTGVPIKAPLVGTFYRASSPELDPFVKVGDRVTANTVVCIIEAMKVMNEVKAGVTGVVRRVLAENGAVVEFGQPLFEVEEA